MSVDRLDASLKDKETEEDKVSDDSYNYVSMGLFVMCRDNAVHEAKRFTAVATAAHVNFHNKVHFNYIQ